MNINITPQSKISVAVKKLCSKLEDALLSLALWITNYWQPDFLMNWIDQYATKRIRQLKMDQVRNNWKMVGLQEAVEQIGGKQN